MTAQADAIHEFLHPHADGIDRLADDFNVSRQPEGRRPSPLLDSKETSVPLRVPDDYRAFLTSGITRQIEQAKHIYEAMPDALTSNRLHNFHFCRTDAWFVRHSETGEVRVQSNRCGLRWCPLCIRTRRFVIVQSVSKWLICQKQPKFLTLTLKHTESPLAQQIDNLYKFFKIFRRRSWFKKHLRGGIWFFQVKKSGIDGLWHPHLHIVFDGRFLPHDEVRQIWKKITKTSCVVDVRSVKNPKKAAEYVARYSAAPCQLSGLDDDRAFELVMALHNRRIVGTFGTGRGIKLTAEAPPDSECWQCLGSFGSVVRNADSDARSLLIVECWRNESYCPIEPEKPPPIIPDCGEKTVNEPERFVQTYLDFY